MVGLVDTGATRSIIRPDYFRKIAKSRRPTLQAMERPVRLADGRQAQVEGQVELEVSIPGLATFCQPFIVMQVSEAVILGMDLLVKQGVVVNVVDKVLVTPDKVVGCVSEAGLPSARRVVLASDLELPPWSETIIGATLVGRRPEEVPEALLVSGRPRLGELGIIVARSVCEAGRSEVAIRLLNASQEVQRLHSGTTVADVEEVEVLGSAQKVVDDPVGSSSSKGAKTGSLPSHLVDLFERAAERLGPSERLQLRELLCEFQDIFAKSKEDLGRTRLVHHHIDTGSALPIKQRARRLPLHQQQAEHDEVERMLKAGIIEESSSPWASPIVLVNKKGGRGVRFCVDFRKVNAVTRGDSYPLPNTHDCLDSLRGSSWFSTVDLCSGYWQLPLAPADREKTAFYSGQALWQFTVMPFGLKNAPGTFERLMDQVLRGLRLDVCLVYLDDVIVKGRTFEEHLNNLKEVLARFRQAGLKLSPEKCHMMRDQVAFLGHIVTPEGVTTDPDKTKAVQTWPVPTDLKTLRAFVGFCSYFRRFIRNFAAIAKPLHHLTEKGVEFLWSHDCQVAFDSLKQSLVQAPMLEYPDPNLPFILDTDASATGVGAVLSQCVEGVERVVAYYSRVLSKPERNYCVTRRELLAVVESVKHFHHYLYGSQFTVRSDHGSLRWLMGFKNLEGQLGRWLETLGTYSSVQKLKRNTAPQLCRWRLSKPRGPPVLIGWKASPQQTSAGLSPPILPWPLFCSGKMGVKAVLLGAKWPRIAQRLNDIGPNGTGWSFLVGFCVASGTTDRPPLSSWWPLKACGHKFSLSYIQGSNLVTWAKLEL